ncbi:MAG: hypothetical protein E7208_03935 [Clostridium butyricum]|nr:hypothetical protein [Clostridium butyricum]
MFGYVTPLKGEMKVKDYERFKCYYCGLCCHIKNVFGNIPRASLNYDMTFLGLLLDGLSPKDLKVKQHRCMLHPTTKKIVIDDNEALSYAAAINISLVYYKFIDDVNDDNDFKSKLKATLLSPYQKRFSNSIIEINCKINQCLNDLSLLEKKKTFYSIDEICDPFSKLVGLVLKEYPFNLADDSVELRDTLYQLGYSIGKWIYLIDALDDLKSDMEKNKFNPINYLYNKDNLDYTRFIEAIKSRMEFTILNCGYTCTENLKKLNLTRNKDILFNIIELGLMDKYLKVMENQDKTNESKRSDL